jgi:hypothetical protein
LEDNDIEITSLVAFHFQDRFEFSNAISQLPFSDDHPEGSVGNSAPEKVIVVSLPLAAT